MASEGNNVLIVDDQVGEILWLLELLYDRGYEVNVIGNEKDAIAALEGLAAGAEDYVAAIFDVMVATVSIEEIIRAQVSLDDRFFEGSKDTGLRLCQKARDLKLDLPIACLTVRQDAAVEKVKQDLGIPVFHRIPLEGSESILKFIEEYLPALVASKAASRVKNEDGQSFEKDKQVGGARRSRLSTKKE